VASPGNGVALNAMQRLEKLRQLRMRGLAPATAVLVVTERTKLQQFEEMNLPTIEVWTGILDRLDWRGVAGLDIVAVVHWRGFDDRMRLFEQLRNAQPSKLHWIATAPGGAPRECNYSVIIEDGEVWQPSNLMHFENAIGGIYGRV
jgi:hypothetical protein